MTKLKSKCCGYKIKVVGRTTKFYMCCLCLQATNPVTWDEKTQEKIDTLKLKNII